MRPFVRPPWDPAWSAYPLVDVVFQQLGRYCAACERPLTVGCFLYEPETGRLVGGRASEAGFDAVLPLCDNCASAAIQQEATVANATTAVGEPLPGLVLRPDVEVSFTLTPESPLRYQRRTFDVAGLPTALVIAVAGNARGQATIDHFALNTAYAVEPTNSAPATSGALAAVDRIAFVPGTGLTWPDPRLELRTKAWDLATALVPLLNSDDPVLAELMIGHTRTAIHYSGFWSVWATVLADAFPGSALLPRLLLPPRRISAASRLARSESAAFESAGLTGHAGEHPGTRTDWLPPQWLAELTSGGAR